MPLETNEEIITLALRPSDFMNALNRDILKGSGLPATRHKLQIDGEASGAFDAMELAYRRNHLRFARMMMVENALKEYHAANLPAAVNALESIEREVLSLQRAAALPKPHRYRLGPASGAPFGSIPLATRH
jgi:hypothetical protein